MTDNGVDKNRPELGREWNEKDPLVREQIVLLTTDLMEWQYQVGGSTITSEGSLTYVCGYGGDETGENPERCKTAMEFTSDNWQQWAELRKQMSRHIFEHLHG